MKKTIRAIKLGAAAAIAALEPAATTLALSFSDFSDSVSGKIGQSPSDLDVIIASAWLIMAIIAIYIAYRLSVAKQRRAVDEAYRRMMERKRRPPRPSASQKPHRPSKPYKPGHR